MLLSRLLQLAGGSMSQRQACEEYHVPRTTLQKILIGKTHIGANQAKNHFSGLIELEIKLVDYSGNLASLGIGFGKSQFLDYARQRVWNATKYIFTICVVLF